MRQNNSINYMDSLVKLNLNMTQKFMNFSASYSNIYLLVIVLTKKCLLLMEACSKKMELSLMIFVKL
jgi:hypothetical protein